MNTTFIVATAKQVVKHLPKILVKVAEIGVPLASGYYAKKELDELVGKKVAEEVAKQMQHK